MEEKIKDLFEKIRRTAEIVLEHQKSRVTVTRNHIPTLGAEAIIAMCDEALEEIEKEKATKLSLH